MCILSIKDASKYKKSIISNWFNKAIRINRANCHYIDKVYPGEAGVKKIYIFCTSLVIPPPFYVIKIVPAAATCGGGWNLWDPPPPPTHKVCGGGREAA